MQAWFQLLDMGLTPTMARETARYRGGAIDAGSLRGLLRALEGIFVFMALLGATLIITFADTIAGSWLKVQHLPLAEVRQAVMLMGVIVAIRWVCGLYRGAINGFERQVWLSGFNAAVATARFVPVIPVLIYIDNSPTAFFSYQLIVGVLVALTLVTQTYRLLPSDTTGKLSFVPQLKPLRGVIKFSLSIAFTSSVWVLVTQTDKLVLSKLLPLSDYAYFTLAVLLAGGVSIISGPIGGALLPRLTKLVAEGSDFEMIRLYRNATQLVAAIAVPAALVLAFFSEQVLWAWTGDAEIARNAAPVLRLYAIGNGILALEAFPYYLQYAKGDLKLHLIGNFLFVVLLIPAIVWATWMHGVTGAGLAWLCVNAGYFLVWIPLVHGRLAAGLHLRWLLQDIVPILGLAVIAGTIFNAAVVWPNERHSVALIIMSIGVMIFLAACSGSSMIRAEASRRWRANRASREVENAIER
jgi:O-antigen/teichoic acid export membrane protein